MPMLIIRIRILYVWSVHTSVTYACTKHMHKELMCALSICIRYFSEHKHKELKIMLSVEVECLIKQDARPRHPYIATWSLHNQLCCSSGPPGRWRCFLSLAIGRYVQVCSPQSPDISWRHFSSLGQLLGTKVLENAKSAERVRRAPRDPRMPRTPRTPRMPRTWNMVRRGSVWCGVARRLTGKAGPSSFLGSAPQGGFFPLSLLRWREAPANGDG